tara:strand:+ start:274 stop:1080 length:807 start_codon:yes stop_codon:yes gene_type:complete
MTENTETTGEETTSNEAETNQAEANWKEALPEDVREDPSMQAIQTVDNLAKSYVNAQKMIGADKIIVPNKYAEENEWQDVFTKLGLPETPDKYEIAVNDKEVDKEFFSNFKQAAHGAGILPNQAQKIFDWYNEASGKMVQDQTNQTQATEKEAIDSLRNEWGSAYDSKLKAAHAGVSHYGNEELTAFLEETGLGNNPNIIKTFAKIGESLSEDAFKDGGPTNFGMTPQDAQTQINSVMADKKHPYHDKYHPNHTNAVSEVTKLFEHLG